MSITEFRSSRTPHTGRNSDPSLYDPFDGFFQTYNPFEVSWNSVVNIPAARRWFEYLNWVTKNNFYVFQQAMEAKSGPQISRGGTSFTMLSSCDYLGLIGDHRVLNASIDAAKKYGTGTGGVRLLTGTAVLHRELEETIADHIGVEGALTFSSGYMANLGALSSLLTPNSHAFIDTFAHRSLKDGCRLSRAKVHSFAHNDIASLRSEMQRISRNARKFILVDGLYSMDGDACPLPDLIKLKKEFNAHLIVDEAHSLGVLGQNGRGVTEHFNCDASDIDVITGSLSKAVPSNGGFVAGNREMIVYLQHGASQFFFSAALCPPAAGAAKKAFEIIQTEPERVATLKRNGDALRVGLSMLGYDVGASVGPLIPVITGDDRHTYVLALELLRRNIIAMPIVHPAVSKGSSRLRLCVSATHSTQDIERCLNAFADVAPCLRQESRLESDAMP